MDIIRIKNADYARYEELLFERDQLRKEANIYHGLYVREFGELHLGIFEKQVACIKKKKLIACYQTAINRGGMIDQTKIEAMLRSEMEEYQRKLQDMIDENEAARKISEITTVKLLKIRRIYRRLAKQLHPDINPKTAEIPELTELWNMIVASYTCNSLEELEEAEVLVSRALERLGMGCTEIEIPDIGAKIEVLEEEIRRIRETDPYQYRYLLEDPQSVEERRGLLEEQKKSYEDYERELDSVIEGLLGSGVRVVFKLS